MGDDDTRCCETHFWVDVGISFILVLFAGLTSGLSLGLLSHSKVDLEVLIKSGSPKHQKNAAKILPIVKNESFVLCTLLIAKSLATEALPIFVDRILPFWSAILVSVIFVVAFVEVIPQAVCSRHGLSLGAKFTLFVRFLFFILSPVSYPVSKMLDWLLGKNHSPILRRAELKTLVDLHGVKAGKGGDLTDDETTIISGALGMTEKIAKDAMTPLSKAFCLDINSKLDMHTMKIIASKGHSRIPIYSDNPANIIGLILVKNLIFYHPEDETPIKRMTIRRILRVYENWPLYEVLKAFQEGHGHMAVVVKSETDAKETNHNSITIHSDIQPKETNGRENPSVFHRNGEIRSHSLDNARPLNRWDQVDENISNEELEALRSRFMDEEVVGIITMEDVLEELLQEEIRDETDQHVEIHDKSSVYQHNWRSAATSFSSYYNTPVLHSPPSSFFPSPIIRSVISTSSPGGPTLSSSRSFSATRGSLLLHQLSSVSRQVSRRSNEAF
ncbi:hypothetical protein DH2020_009891 [Rehmannia glutinosa]|uniref:CNNM transmembrane domain-containing protein n=1 Tax=Rehmannia glutinosa TaxID=99300 RepID=A0ABR0X8M0_REHGL